MNDWMIRWAFAAPFATVGTQLCGWIALLALISYGLAFLTVNVRGPWGWGFALEIGVLTVLMAFSAQTMTMGSLSPEQLPKVMKFSALGLLLIATFSVVDIFFRKQPDSPRRWPTLIWDYSMGIAYALGFLGCGPYFTTLSASASMGGWQGVSQLSAYALGMLILTGIVMLLIALAHRFSSKHFQRERQVRSIRLLGLLGLLIAGFLSLWA